MSAMQFGGQQAQVHCEPSEEFTSSTTPASLSHISLQCYVKSKGNPLRPVQEMT